MLLHTVVPYEAIFDVPNPTQPTPPLRQIDGGLLQLDEQGRVSRLISTDPRLYLDPRYAPGACGGHYAG